MTALASHAVAPRGRLAMVVLLATCALAARPAPAEAFNPIKPICGAASLASGLLGKACGALQGVGRVVGAGKQLLGGHFGSALKSILGQGASAAGSGATAALGLAAIGAWVLGGAKFVLHEAGKALGESTAPHLDTSWFSATYWRVAGIAALLTLPFLFAAAVQALTRSDVTLLLRAVLGYLPLAMLAVTVAAPLTTLLLSGSDELSTLVSSATGQPGAHALGLGIGLAGGLTLLTGSPFFVFFFGLLTAAGAMILWMELLMREAAVYVVVLMLPLAFAALVWPARRVWAIRAVELLVALILSKFAIVAVLALGGAAVDQVGHSVTALVLGLVLVVMAAFSPWALLRLVPLAEVASSAAATLRGEVRGARGHADWAARNSPGSEDWATQTVAGMRRTAEQALPPIPGGQRAGNAGSDAGADAPMDTPAEADPAPEPDGAGLDSVDPTAPAPSPGGLSDGPEPTVDPSPEPPVGPSSTDPRERLPGLDPMWQADDLSWRPIVLGDEEGWPPRPWPPEGDLGAGLGEPADGTPGLPPPQEPAPESPVDQHPALPPGPEPPSSPEPPPPPERA